MLQEYRHAGVAFRYPGTWELTDEEADGQRIITLQTEGASFWTLTLFADRPDPELMVASVLEAFREDYEEIDIYPVQDTILRQPAAAVDLDFVYLDLVNSVVIRAFLTDSASALVLYQGMDLELEQQRPEFDAVTESLVFEDPTDD